MTQTISRTYHSREDAEAAANKLTSAGFAHETINVVAPADGDAEAISRGGVASTHTDVYAEALRRGETLVSVRAAFGCAATVASILGQFNPTDTGLDDPGYEPKPYDAAAPLSSALGWRVLSDNPTPLSSYFGWRTLTTQPPVRKPDRTLVDNPAPLSKAIGMPLLSDKPAILSRRLGWRLLWDNAAPLSTRLGWPVLSKTQEPPRTRFGFPLLSHNPAPLSKALGLKLLSSNPAPLSKLFNWRVLSRDPSK